MTGWLLVLLVGASLVLWVGYLDQGRDFESRLARWCVRRAPRRALVTASVGLLASVAAASGYAGLSWLCLRLGHAAGNDAWALLPAYPVMLGYLPFAWTTAVKMTAVPASEPHASWRAALRRAGADPQQERAIAWPAGVPSAVGVVFVLVTILEIFVL